MNLLKSTLLTLSILSLPAFAIYDPSWERPVENIAMDLVEARGSFANASQISVTLNRRDGATHVTSLTMAYTNANGEHLQKDYLLEGENAITEECGSIIYNVQIGSGRGARDSLQLQDNRNRHCRDLRPHVFELSARSGYGWCGTMDSTLSAGGNAAEPMATIQSVNITQ